MKNFPIIKTTFQAIKRQSSNERRISQTVLNASNMYVSQFDKKNCTVPGSFWNKRS